MSPAFHSLVRGSAVTVALAGVAIGAWALYRAKQAKTAASVSATTGNGAYTTSAEEDAAGLNIALDTGTGGVIAALPNSAEFDAYTGTLSTGIDPTTGETGIGNTEDVTEQQLGDYSPQLSLQPALSQSQIDALNGD